MRGSFALALLAIGWGIAAARFDPDRQVDARNRGHEIALYVVRQRLQRRDIERVQAFGWRYAAKPRGAELGQRGEKPGERLASPGIGHTQRVPAAIRGDRTSKRLNS